MTVKVVVRVVVMIALMLLVWDTVTMVVRNYERTAHWLHASASWADKMVFWGAMMMAMVFLIAVIVTIADAIKKK